MFVHIVVKSCLSSSSLTYIRVKLDAAELVSYELHRRNKINKN